jgi:hypothetical protein
MIAATIEALAAFPARLETTFAEFPAALLDWSPPSWDGVPSEAFTPIAQICHLRDIEVDGYRERFRRALGEDNPLLPTLDGFALARQRAYAEADPGVALAAFRAARADTVELLSALGEREFERPAIFEDYGALTVRSLVHLLCSHDQQHLAGLHWLLARIDMTRAAAPAQKKETT